MRALLFLVAFLVAPSPAQAADPPTIHVETEVDERYYDVFGADADQVFASIERRGLGGRAGLSASGLTESEIAFTLTTTTTPTSCRLDAVTLRIEVTVTLPRHGRPRDLDPDTLRNWQAYEAQVEFHEYRHVEIEFRGVQEIQERLAREPVQRSSGSAEACTAFVRRAIDEQNATTRRRHEAFHAEEKSTVLAAQAAIVSQIELADAELALQKAEITRLEAAQADLDAARRHLTSTLDTLIESYGRELPPDLFTRASELEGSVSEITDELNETIALRNALVTRYNGAIRKREKLSGRLAWTR